MEVAKRNAVENGVDITFMVGDMFENVSGKFNTIISNPPYIRRDDIDDLDVEIKNFEPVLALDGGVDGLDFYRKIALLAPDHLCEGGIVFMECGEGQAEDIKNIFSSYTSVEIKKDINGIDRIIKATL